MTALEKILSKHIDGGPGAWKKLYDELEEYAQLRTAELDDQYSLVNGKYISKAQELEAENKRLRSQLNQAVNIMKVINDGIDTSCEFTLPERVEVDLDDFLQALEGLGE